MLLVDQDLVEDLQEYSKIYFIEQNQFPISFKVNDPDNLIEHGVQVVLALCDFVEQPFEILLN